MHQVHIGVVMGIGVDGELDPHFDRPLRMHVVQVKPRRVGVDLQRYPCL